MQNFFKEKFSERGNLYKRVPVMAFLMLSVTVATLLLFSSVKTIKISDGIKTYVVSCISGDTDKALSTAGLNASDYKLLSCKREGNSTNLLVTKTFPVKIVIGNKTVTVKTAKATVGEILNNAGYTVDGDDIVTPSVNTVIKKSCFINFTDVNYTTYETTEEIPYSSETVYSSALDVGQTVNTGGKAGLKKTVYTKKCVNGVETEKTVASEEILISPVNAVTTVGTKKASAPAALAGGAHVYTSCLTKTGGVYKNPYTGLRETYYSQKVLPGGGLVIPGRHVNEEGFVCDGDGFICVASNDYAKGTVIETSRGMGKVYDCGCARGTLDVYVNW